MIRTLRWAPAVAIYGTITWLSHQARWPDFAVGFPDWLLHGGAYAALGASIWFGLGGGRRSVLAPVLMGLACLLASLGGAVDEVHQSFVIGRSATVGDWFADTLGAVVGVLAVQAAAFAGLRGLWENRHT